MRFNKPALNLHAQLELLKERGLIITDEASALSILENIGYYRLSAYTYPFRTGSPRNQFKQNAYLEQIVRIYDFDRELRLLVSDAIERAEVGLRARLVNCTCLHYQNPHWFMDASNFHSKFNHHALLKSLERHLDIKEIPKTGDKILPQNHAEAFIEHYYLKYGDPYLPPFWMSTEVLTFGSISHLFQGLGNPTLKKKIADPFGVPAKVFASWLHSIAHLRNICAHHGRLWNRKFSISPTRALKHSNILHHPHRFEGHSVVLLTILDICSPKHAWRKRFKELLNRYPEVDHAAMGYPNNWLSEPFWNIPD